MLSCRFSFSFSLADYPFIMRLSYVFVLLYFYWLELSDDERLCRHVFPGMYLHRKDIATGSYCKSNSGFCKIDADQDCSLAKEKESATWKLDVEEVILNKWIHQKIMKDKKQKLTTKSNR